MASAREYFDKDSSRNMRAHATHAGTDPHTGEAFEIIAAVSLDFEANAKYGSLYIPETRMASTFVEHYLSHINDLLKVSDGVLVQSGFVGTDENISSSELGFSGRLFVYTPYKFTAEEKARLIDIALREGIKVVVRDGAYSEARAKLDKPLAFISHDSRDKESLVRELAATLQKMLCPVWYDEYSLVAGQSLRESIEAGLRDCKKCVLVLSPAFLSNGGWTKAEFDSVFTREILEQRNVIVPIWHGVTKEEIYAYSPRLLDKVGITSSLGIEEVARRVLRAVNYEA